MIYRIHLFKRAAIVHPAEARSFPLKEGCSICATPLGAAATVRAHGTARSMRDKAEETMSRNAPTPRSSSYPARGGAEAGPSSAWLASRARCWRRRWGRGRARVRRARRPRASAAPERRTPDDARTFRIVGAGIVCAASEDGEWWLGYPLGEQVDDVPTHYSHIMRNFVPSVLRCTAVNGPGACYDVHLPLARLRELGAGEARAHRGGHGGGGVARHQRHGDIRRHREKIASLDMREEKFVARLVDVERRPRARARGWASAARVPAGSDRRRRRLTVR